MLACLNWLFFWKNATVTKWKNIRSAHTQIISELNMAWFQSQDIAIFLRSSIIDYACSHQYIIDWMKVQNQRLLPKKTIIESYHQFKKEDCESPNSDTYVYREDRMYFFFWWFFVRMSHFITLLSFFHRKKIMIIMFESKQKTNFLLLVKKWWW